jgi:hypothetical protein
MVRVEAIENVVPLLVGNGIRTPDRSSAPADNEDRLIKKGGYSSCGLALGDAPLGCQDPVNSEWKVVVDQKLRLPLEPPLDLLPDVRIPWVVFHEEDGQRVDIKENLSFTEGRFSCVKEGFPPPPAITPDRVDGLGFSPKENGPFVLLETETIARLDLELLTESLGYCDPSPGVYL